MMSDKGTASFGTKTAAIGQRFAGLVALVTGGGTGIGEAAARRIAAEGGKVVLTGRRLEPIQKVANEIGGIAVAGDTADSAHVSEAVQTAVKEFGGLDVVIACAGVAQFGAVETLDINDWRDNFKVNVDGAMLVSQYAIPELRKRGGGSIVLVSSMAALTGGPNGAPYLASKAAMLGLNRSIATDYGVDNIRCNAICPGWAPTDMSKATLAGLAEHKGVSGDDFFNDITKAIPLKRMGAPSEMGAAIAFLASTDASFVNGTTMIVDGGANIIDGSSVPLLP